MSAHENERLSAYLDGELAPAERSEVAVHLAACAECATRLAELAAVDDAARALAADAASGYFEALPSRVRARLEPRRGGRRLPAWSWAVAAALLLAVVAPLTVKQLAPLPSGPAIRQEAPPAAAPEARQPAAAAAPPPQATADESRSDAAPGEARREASNAAPKTASAANTERAKRTSEPGFAAAPADKDRAQPQQQPPLRLEARPTAPPAAPAPPPAASSALARSQAPPAAAEAGAADARALRSPESPAARDEAVVQAPAEEKEAAAGAAAKAQATPARSPLPSAGGRIEERVAAPSTPLTDAEWRRLVAARPQTADEWRRLREELRRFAEASAERPHAAAARLRTIEAGYAAWRAGGDAADEAVFRADALAYLERDDARDQDKSRVRQLLR